MNANPPRAGKWLLTHFGCSPNNIAVIGDLDERYRNVQSAAWYWQQVVAAITLSFFKHISAHALLTVRAIAVGWGTFIVTRYALIVARESLSVLPQYLSANWMMIIGWSETLLAGILAGWIVAKLPRQSPRAMVLAFAVSLVAVITPLALTHRSRDEKPTTQTREMAAEALRMQPEQ
jgi:hypothetical protein